MIRNNTKSVITEYDNDRLVDKGAGALTRWLGPQGSFYSNYKQTGSSFLLCQRVFTFFKNKKFHLLNEKIHFSNDLPFEQKNIRYPSKKKKRRNERGFKLPSPSLLIAFVILVIRVITMRLMAGYQWI